MRDILAVGDLRLLHVPPDPALSGFYQSWAGEHDLQFLKGVVEHGIGNWAAIFKDPNLPLLSSLHGLPADTKVLSRRLQVRFAGPRDLIRYPMGWFGSANLVGGRPRSRRPASKVKVSTASPWRK